MHEQPPILHNDAYNKELLSLVHSGERKNPKAASYYNIAIIGAGTAGLVTAAIASGLGARVALIERRFFGGDCLNFGCVPSKTFIRASRASYQVRTASRYGIEPGQDISIDSRAVMDRVRRVRAQIGKNDSVERFTKLGVDIFFGNGFFSGPGQVTVDEASFGFRKAVIATGTYPVIPTIPGLIQSGYFTNETVFEIDTVPKRLGVIGAGPIGCELAQAFQRLGSQVVLFHKHDRILDREDADASEIVQEQFRQEGIELRLNSNLLQVTTDKGQKRIEFEHRNSNFKTEVDEILVATGRAPNVEDLGLNNAQVKFDKSKGVVVNDYLQTTNPHIYAAGDVCMTHKFTHAADAAARFVVENALFRRSRRVSDMVIPWSTYTDPEISHVGLFEREAVAKGIRTKTIKLEMHEIDRAMTDGIEAGFVKFLLRENSDKILGATIVSPIAGELINEITLAIRSNIGLKTISETIHPYPTQSQVIKRLADSYMSSRLTPGLKWLMKKWFWLNRLF